MSRGITVARIGADQGSLLRALRLAALADAPGAFGQTLGDAAAQRDEDWASTARASSAGDRRAWFIAFSDNRPIGLVQGRRRPPHDCLVFSMWVDPTVRRAGVGRALLDAVDEWARGWGARKVVLWVIGGNHGALRFYERLGFGLVESGPDADSGALYGALAMSRSVSRSV
jgi:GNAT superfamily N-acetyltransferase